MAKPQSFIPFDIVCSLKKKKPLVVAKGFIIRSLKTEYVLSKSSLSKFLDDLQTPVPKYVPVTCCYRVLPSDKLLLVIQ